MITETIYRGMESFQFEGSLMNVVVFRHFGGKIVSLADKEGGYEFLWQGQTESHPRSAYGSSYAEGDLSGMDDMFPTINECPYPTQPWRGTIMPDHGELWSIPWQSEVSDRGDSIRLWTHGVRLPYRYEKRLSLTAGGTLHIDYRISNLSGFDMVCMWALHPLFTVEEGSCILLPGSIKTLENTLNFNNRLGPAGAVHTWPVTTDKYGRSYDVSRIPPRNAETCEKFYAREQLLDGKAGITYPSIGKKMMLSFDKDNLPYLGIWINAGGLKGHFNAAIEPASGALDDLYIAHAREKHGVIPANGSFGFSIDISIDNL